jgi:transcription termination/antitermination protein NusA
MSQARTEFAAALSQIASEKGVEVEVVLDAIRQAALAAYKKDLAIRNEVIPDDIEEFTSSVDPITGEISIFSGDKNVTPPGFARIAAGIARQVIMQKLHEAEKGAIMSEYEGKVGNIISGSIQRQEGNLYFIDLGRAEGVMPPPEQVHIETYLSNQRMKFLIKAIKEEGRGPQVIVSRADPGLVKGLFGMEVPEIQNGNVEIKAIAREAGSRTKIAVISHQEGVDPVGSLVGQKGVRVQTVMQELGDEKIDIISFSEDPARFIAAALSPAKEVQIKLNEEEKLATVSVPNNQLSLAIGKGGQNVRLAAKLTGYKIDIEGTGEEEKQVSEDGGSQVAPTDDTKVTVELPAEPDEKGREKAETEATIPGDSKEQAVVEAVEENITAAEQAESVGGELQEEEDVPAEPQAAADAEADIAEEDTKEKSSDESSKNE